MLLGDQRYGWWASSLLYKYSDLFVGIARIYFRTFSMGYYLPQDGNSNELQNWDWMIVVWGNQSWWQFSLHSPVLTLPELLLSFSIPYSCYKVLFHWCNVPILPVTICSQCIVVILAESDRKASLPKPPSFLFLK